MEKRLPAILGVAVGVVAFAGVARATHNEPVQAKEQKGEFVTAYNACTMPTRTTSNGFPACTAVRSTLTCGFGSAGKGKYLAKVASAGGDIDVQATLVGLDTGCMGQVLTLTTSVRATTDDCTGQSCTVVDLNDFPITSCTVTSSGKCNIKTTVNSALPGTILGNKRTGIMIKGVNLFLGSTPAFSGGVFVP